MKVSYAIVLAGVALLSGCAPTTGEPVGDEGWVPVPLEHARCFELERRGDERRLTVFGAGGKADTVGVYLLGTSDDTGFHGPIKRLAVASTTHLSYLHALHALPLVVGAAHMDELQDDTMRMEVKRFAAEINTADGPDRERLIALAPEALLDYPFGQGGSTPPLHGMQRISVTEYLEEHPLGRAEWIRFFGVLVGKEHEADSIYYAIAARYRQAIRGRTDDLPGVFFGSTWQNQWFVPPGNSYMATLIADAGGEYLYKDERQQGNITLDLEAVIEACTRSRYFGVLLAYPGTVDARLMVGGDVRLAAMSAVGRGGFVGNSATHDLFGKALLEPDMVLRDLVCIFHPGHCGGHEPRYFRPLDQ
jgi:iron complex transport system substrate-binding protein